MIGVLRHSVKLIVICSLFFIPMLQALTENQPNQEEPFITESCTKNSKLYFDDCDLCSGSMGRTTVSKQIQDDCVITEDDMIHLLQLLQNAWSIITGTFYGGFGVRQTSKVAADDETSCVRMTQMQMESPKLSSRPLGIFNACQELVDDMEELIINLTEQIRVLIGWLDDPENLNPRIAQLEECLRCVNRKLDDTIAHYDQQLGNITEQMGEMQQCFTLVILQRKQEIQELQLRLEAKSYDLIKNSVNASNFASALAEYVRLNNETILNSLVDDIYSSSKIENLLRFAYLLPQPSQRIKMYKKIKLTLEIFGHDQTMHMVSFTKIFYDDVERLCGCKQVKNCDELPTEFKDNLGWVDKSIKNVKRSLTTDICASNTSDILKSASPESSINLAGYAIQDVLDDLFMSSYANCADKFAELVKFAYDLRWNKHRLQAFTTLISIASNDDERLKIAIKMKMVMETLAGPDGDMENIMDDFVTQRYKLPAKIRNIVWHSACNLRSPDYENEYLTIDKSYGGGNSGVYTKADNDTRAMWIFKPIENAKFEYEFLIENSQTGDYLGTHIPWKNRNDGYGIAAANNPDDGEYTRRHYRWQVHFPDSSTFIQLFHIGRQANLIPLNEHDEELQFVGLELAAWGASSANWAISCNNY